MKIKTISDLLLFEDESTTVKSTLEAAVRGGADLRGADLRGADLRGADLGGAYLRGADLRGADLRGADLGGAYLRGAYLRGAKVAWQSHALLAEILLRAAGEDVDKRKVAGLIAVSLDWCWPQLLRLDDPLKPWALTELAKCVTDGDGHPSELDAYRATPEPAEAKEPEAS